MNTAVGWSPGQRALLRLLQREGVLAEEPAAPGDGPATNAQLFARLADAIDQRGLVSLVADSLRVPSVDLDEEALMQDLVSLLTPELAATCEMIPLAQCDDTLEVAAANPLDLDAVKTIEFMTGLRVRPRVTTRASVLRALAAWYGIPTPAEPAAAPASISIAAAPRALPVAGSAPAGAAPDPAVSEPPAEDVARTPARGTGRAGVLVVSAALDVRRKVRAVLEAEPLATTVMTARDRAEAQAVLRAGHVDVLVIDAADAPAGDGRWERLAGEARAGLVLLGVPPGAAPAATAPSHVRAQGLDTLVAGVRRILIDQRGEPT